MIDLNKNDEVIAFLRGSGYPSSYNDGLYQFLRDYYDVNTSSLPDLLSRLKKDNPTLTAPIFTPAILFGSGEEGCWYDPSDLSTMYQDAAGTTPVTSHNDPVGLIQDKSGNAYHMTQSTAGFRPLYQTDGVLHWLKFDGVDDFLLTTNNVNWTGVTQLSIFSGFEKTSDTTRGIVFNKRSNGAGAFAVQAPTTDATPDLGFFMTDTSTINELAFSPYPAPQTVAVCMKGGVATPNDGFTVSFLIGDENASVSKAGTGGSETFRDSKIAMGKFAEVPGRQFGGKVYSNFAVEGITSDTTERKMRAYFRQLMKRF